MQVFWGLDGQVWTVTEGCLSSRSMFLSLAKLRWVVGMANMLLSWYAEALSGEKSGTSTRSVSCDGRWNRVNPGMIPDDGSYIKASKVVLYERWTDQSQNPTVSLHPFLFPEGWLWTLKTGSGDCLVGWVELTTYEWWEALSVVRSWCV